MNLYPHNPPQVVSVEHPNDDQLSYNTGEGSDPATRGSLSIGLSTRTKLKTWRAKLGLVTLLVLLAPMALAGASASSASPAAGGSSLQPGETLNDGQSLVNGHFTMAMQTDGNFVLYAGTLATWQSGTAGRGGAWVSMQTDGNLVLYNAASQPLWWTGTAGHGGSSLQVQTDGNVVIYTSANQPLWATNTAAPAPPPVTSRSTTPIHIQTAAGFNVYEVTMTGTDSFNGVQATGYVSGVDCHIDLPIGVGLSCNGFTKGSYRTSTGVWEDWLNYRVSYISPILPWRYSYSDCIYLRVDTPPNGHMTTQNFANRNLPLGTHC